MNLKSCRREDTLAIKHWRLYGFKNKQVYVQTSMTNTHMYSTHALMSHYPDATGGSHYQAGILSLLTHSPPQRLKNSCLQLSDLLRCGLLQTAIEEEIHVPMFPSCSSIFKQIFKIFRINTCSYKGHAVLTYLNTYLFYLCLIPVKHFW